MLKKFLLVAESVVLLLIMENYPVLGTELTCTSSSDPSITDHSNGSVPNIIQWCINSLAFGGTVNLEAGTYSTLGTIVLASNITIRGEGADLTTIQYNGGGRN